MKKKRAFAALLAAALCLGMLAGCGGTPTGSGENNTPGQPTVPPSTNLKKPPQPDQILSDIIQWGNLGLPDGVDFTACEVIKRQSNPEDKEDIVYCQLTTESPYYRIQRQYRCLYNFYVEGGWILDELTPDKEDQWMEAYLDAAGNDILEDMVWLDAFTESQLRNMRYFGELGGTHYLVETYRSNGSHCGTVYRQSGAQMGSWASDAELSPLCAFLNEAGELRFITDRSDPYPSGDGVTHVYRIITDANGNRIGEGYQRVTRYTIVGHPDWHAAWFGGLCGVIDGNGNIVTEPTYSNARDIPGIQIEDLPEFETVPTPDGLSAPFTGVPNGLFMGDRSIDGWKAPDLFDGHAEAVVSVAHEAAMYDWTTGLVMVFPQCYNKQQGMPSSPGGDAADMSASSRAGGVVVKLAARPLSGMNSDFTFDYYSSPFRFYDLNGNCRSPEFTWVQGASYSGFVYGRIDGPRASAYDVQFVRYQGRIGILPQILTDEEMAYFQYQWGLEHTN